MKRYGVVLVFREDLTREEITEKLETLKHEIDPGYTSVGGVPRVQSFDDKLGGPVWYIP